MGTTEKQLIERVNKLNCLGYNFEQVTIYQHIREQRYHRRDPISGEFLSENNNFGNTEGNFLQYADITTDRETEVRVYGKKGNYVTSQNTLEKAVAFIEKIYEEVGLKI
jgi:hypothetical protein